MKNVILVGRQDKILEVPSEKWLEHLEHAQQHPSGRLDFMTPEHHVVRNFAVSELPRNHGLPLKAEDIAQRLSLSLATVKSILNDLQENLFFLVLNPAGEVCWAFPVTAEKTPHRLSFSTGERIYAA
jgi:hypothetical protein